MRGWCYAWPTVTFQRHCPLAGSKLYYSFRFWCILVRKWSVIAVHLCLLWQKHDVFVTAIDLSTNMIHIAQEKANEFNDPRVCVALYFLFVYLTTLITDTLVTYLAMDGRVVEFTTATLRRLQDTVGTVKPPNTHDWTRGETGQDFWPVTRPDPVAFDPMTWPNPVVECFETIPQQQLDSSIGILYCTSCCCQ